MSRSPGRYRKLYAQGVIEGRRINSVPMETEAWFWRLMLIADDYGNLPADEDLIKGRAAPKRRLGPSAIRRMNLSLVEVGLLTPYSAEGEDYFHCAEFEGFQSSPNGRLIQRYPRPEPCRVDPVVSNESGVSVVLVRSPSPSPSPSPTSKSERVQETPPEFIEFWDAYPRKANKKAALKAWPKALLAAGGDAEAIIQGSKDYAASDTGRGEMQHRAHGATWLNGQRWEDDRSAWRHDTKPTPNTTSGALM